MDDAKFHTACGHRVEYFKRGPIAPLVAAPTYVHVLQVSSCDPDVTTRLQEFIFDDRSMQVRSGQQSSRGQCNTLAGKGLVDTLAVNHELVLIPSRIRSVRGRC